MSSLGLMEGHWADGRSMEIVDLGDQAVKTMLQVAVFPHSFTSELVHKLIEEWNLASRDCVLDPFCGSGTTLVAAKEKGVPSKGNDLSPLAVVTTNAKVANYSFHDLQDSCLNA